MNKVIYISLLISGIVTNYSCSKKMAHKIQTATLSEFDTITFNSVFEVFITQGSSNTIQLEGAQKIIENIDIHVENNTLTLVNNYKGNWVHPKNNKIKVYLTVNGITRINANETCNIRTINALTGNEIGLVMTSKLNEAEIQLNCSSFYYWNNFPCGGKISLSGTTNELKLWNVALMAVDASQLTTNIALVDNASKGDCHINCLQKLTYSITGEGNLYVKGNPTDLIKIEESSSGKLIFQ